MTKKSLKGGSKSLKSERYSCKIINTAPHFIKFTLFFSLPNVPWKTKSISVVYRSGGFRRKSFGQFWQVALLDSAIYRNSPSNINPYDLILFSYRQKALLKFTIPLQLAAKTTTTHSSQKDLLLIFIYLLN